MIKNILYTLSFTLLCGASYAQSDCNVSISASSDTVGCGETVELIADGEAYDTLLSEDFNNSSLGPGWAANQTVMFNNPCGAPPDGSPTAWFGDQQTQPRILETIDYDMSCGGEICYMMKYAVQAGSGSCEGPDLANEGVDLQYSTDGGVTWTSIFYHTVVGGGYDPVQTSWNQYCQQIPPGAQTPSTRFRWYQDAGSGAGYDHWGIDDVEVLGSICGTYTYEWQGSGTTGDEDTTVVVTQDQNTYTVIYTDGNDTCSASIDIYGIIDVNLPNDTTICGLTDYDISPSPTLGSGSYDYIWNTGDTTGTLESVTTGQYWVELTDEVYTTCVATDTINFEMYPIPDVDFSADPLCQGAITFFTDETTIPAGYTISSWDWDFDDLGATSTDQNPSHEFSGVGQYSVTLTVDSGDGCTSDTTIIIDIEPSPFADFDFENACEGEEIFFENTSLGNYENSQWIFETAENDTVLSTDASFTFPDDGNYTVTLIIEKSDGACSDTLTETVTINPTPNVEFTASTQIGEPPLEVEFYNQSTGAISYLWDFMNGNTSNSLNDTVSETFTEPGEYPVTLYGTSAAGCENSHTLMITVEFEDLIIQMPNIFTPNGDGANDEYYINYVQAKETIVDFEIVFLNRWGNVLRTFNDPDFEWDGTTENGSKVNDGTYFYKVNISTIKGQTIEEHGPIQVSK